MLLDTTNCCRLVPLLGSSLYKKIGFVIARRVKKNNVFLTYKPIVKFELGMIKNGPADVQLLFSKYIIHFLALFHSFFSFIIRQARNVAIYGKHVVYLLELAFSLSVRSHGSFLRWVTSTMSAAFASLKMKERFSRSLSSRGEKYW